MKNKKGFTIVELVIVIAVIAILAAVLIPTFSGVIQRANESSALQTVTSAMKTVLAQSLSATIADGTYFCVGDKSGVQYIYEFDNQKMGTDNLYSKTASENILYGKTTDESQKLNTLILPVDGELPSKTDTTLAILTAILGQTVTAADIKPVTNADNTVKALLAANAKYYIDIDLDPGTEAEKIFYVGILTNVDFSKDVVVFTYSK